MRRIATLTIIPESQGQTAVAGQAVPVSPTVVATDGNGDPLAAVTVTFSPDGASSGLVVGGTVTTDSQGIATVESWVLGGSVGIQTLNVSSGSVEVALSATAIAGEPENVIPLPGVQNQSANAAAAVETPPAVQVQDSNGNPVAGASVTFTVNQGSGSFGQLPENCTGDSLQRTCITDDSGEASAGDWSLGGASETNTITVSVGTVTPVNINATATATLYQLEKVSGDSQRRLVCLEVDEPVVVRLTSSGVPVAGETVTFRVIGGDGVLDDPEAQSVEVSTDEDGLAETRWRLGPGRGAQQLEAVSGDATAVFSATALGFDVRVPLESSGLNEADDEQVRASFAIAESVWESVIVGDSELGELVDCPGTWPRPDVVSEMQISARIEPIDGPNGILGQAGPNTVFPANGGSTFIVLSGTMVFDSADVSRLIASGDLDTVILHEMGHVIGIGSLWQLVGLTNAGDATYRGAEGLDAFSDLGGSGDQIVELDGGPGTAGGHWDESLFGNELMTGNLNPNGANPFSELTARSLRDISRYEVDLTPTDPYSLPQSGFRAQDSSHELIGFCGSNAYAPAMHDDGYIYFDRF